MNQKVTLRFTDHVLAFTVQTSEVTEITLAFRRKWPYKFARPNGNFHVNFDQVLWMKVSPTGEDVTELGTEETVSSDGGKHGSL